MGVSVHRPITFINQTSDEPLATGVQLALIRSHTSSLQHRQARNLLVNRSKAGVASEVLGDRHVGYEPINQIAPRHYQAWASLGAIYPPAFLGTVQVRVKGHCRNCLAQRLSVVALPNQTVGDGLRFSLCICDSGTRPTKVAVLGTGARVGSDSLRNDPFNALPVQSDSYVHTLIDYYTQTFSPQHDWIYGATGEKHPHTHMFLPKAIQTPYYFHTVLLLCRIFHTMVAGGDPRSDGMVIYHRGKALEELQKSLADVNNDALPLAVVGFIWIDWMLGNLAASAAHSAGPTRILTARIGMPRTRITALIEALVQTIPVKTDDADLSEDNMTLHYPQHPFPSGLRHKLSKLPPGISDLCLSGKVCTTTIMITSRMKVLLLKGQMHRDQWGSLFDWGSERFRAVAMTPIDRLLLQGLLAFCLQYNISFCEENIFHLTEALLDRISPRDDIDLATITQDCCHRDALVWIYLCIVGALDACAQDAESHQDHTSLLDNVFLLFESRKQLQWRKIVPILHRFWFPAHLQEHWKYCWTRGLDKWGRPLNNQNIGPAAADENDLLGLGWG